MAWIFLWKVTVYDIFRTWTQCGNFTFSVRKSILKYTVWSIFWPNSGSPIILYQKYHEYLNYPSALPGSKFIRFGLKMSIFNFKIQIQTYNSRDGSFYWESRYCHTLTRPKGIVFSSPLTHRFGTDKFPYTVKSLIESRTLFTGSFMTKWSI